MVLLLLVLIENGSHGHASVQSQREFKVFAACYLLAPDETVLPFTLDADILAVRHSLRIEFLKLQRDELVLWFGSAHQS